jgi:HPr kinase/phosphorylase
MKTLDDIQVLKQDQISVNALLDNKLGFKLINDVDTDRPLILKTLFRPQLALAGFVESFAKNSILIFGNTENAYLKNLKEEDRVNALDNIGRFNIPCVIITNGHSFTSELLDWFTLKSIPVLGTEMPTENTTYLLFDFLDDQFASRAAIHGSFVDVYGIGILFTGRSGIGKSEIALDLVERGHRLVADDVVIITKRKETVLMGTGTNLVQHFMEIRGLGIIDIRQMFGIRSIRFQKRIEIIVELMDYDSEEDYTRIGLDDDSTNILGVDIFTVKLPIFPGKNITVIAEVIAVNYLLKMYGYNAAQTLAERLQNEISRKSTSSIPVQFQRAVSFIQPDDE